MTASKNGNGKNGNGKRALKHYRPQKMNANKHTPFGLSKLRDSIGADGIIGAITVARDGESFDGSARLETLAEAMPGVKIVEVETDGNTLIVNKRNDIPNANSPRAKRLGVAANVIAKLDYNPDGEILAALAAEDEMIADYVKAERDSLRAVQEYVAENGADAEPQIDRAAELLKKWKVKTGDLWQIGAHRLLCGDSTKREDVERVMDGEKAVLFETDPPYGVDYIKTKSGIPDSGYATLDQDYSDIESDHLKNEEMKEWLQGIFNLWYEFMRPNAAWYLWHPMLTQGYFAAAAAAAAAAAVIIHRQIIWVKSGFNLTRSGMYHWAHELCFYGWSKGHIPEWYGEKNQTTVWAIDRHDGKGLHPTEKPPELWKAPMLNHTLAGEVCAEPFAGSGSQYVMGENLGRRVFGCELEPKYVAVVLERMATAFPDIEIKRL